MQESRKMMTGRRLAYARANATHPAGVVRRTRVAANPEPGTFPHWQWDYSHGFGLSTLGAAGDWRDPAGLGFETG